MHKLSGQTIGRREFIALMAMMFAIVAFSIDAMLPAMPEIASDLSLTNPQYAPLVILIFVMGLGAGTLFMGPISDAYGRRPTVYVGLAIYLVGAALSWVAPTFELMLAARFLQGVGASGPRIVSAAIIRDLFSGREMARILSFSLMLFLLAPALAPMIGALIMELAHWRAIFGVLFAFGLVLWVWFAIRLKETHPSHARRPIRIRALRESVREMNANPVVRLAVIVQTLLMGVLFSILAMVQPIFEIVFDRAETFPYWFGVLAIVSGVSSLLNASLVVRFGMRRLITIALAFQVIMSAVVLFLFIQGSSLGFWIYLVWQFGVLVQAGMTTANLNALAAEPMGHIAGTAASVMAAISTIGGAFIGYQMGLLFDGTPRPLVAGVLVLVSVSSILMQFLRRAELRDEQQA
ncbi:MAG: multidrug effflux MFS transporter [Paracoccaceae bacterium]